MRTSWISVAALAIVLAGCHAAPRPVAATSSLPGGAPATTVPVQHGGAGGNDGAFLATDATGAAFVRWTENQGALVGTYDYVRADSAVASGVDTSELSFTGLHHDDKVSLTLSEGLGTYKTLTGTLSGDTLTLTVPGSDGQLSDEAFQTASVDEYNSAVASFASKAQGQAQASAAQARQRQLDSAVASADSSFGTDLASLSNDLQTFHGVDLGFHVSLGSAATALEATRRDYATEQTDASAPNHDCGTVGSDDGTVGSDEASVESAQAELASDVAGIQGDIAALANDLKRASSDLTGLQTAQGNDPSAPVQHGSSELASLQATAQTATTQAQQAIGQANQTAQSAVDTAKGIQQSADALSASCQ